MTLETSDSTGPSAALPSKNDVYVPNNKDEIILATPDYLYTLITWESAVRTVRENRLADLTRLPSQLKKYLAWCHQIREEYGSVQAFILKERVKWKPEELAPKNETPFADDDDTRILVNDWPYGLEPGIMHIVIWTKTTIPTDESTGDLTPESRSLIENFVKKTFFVKLGLSEDRVVWFKNWAQLQSVRSVEHFHVFVNVQGLEGGEGLVRTVAG